ncbi:MAG: lipopolysaccharide biosynthesis protein [Deltaproteobacteria bacterium]|nr:lipopolysaccharide biosynthesis protein [Deltaproteobacteria bacterium]
MGLIKEVFGASAIIILGNGLNRLFAILAAPVLTPILGPTPYGVMALVGTATSLASTLGLLGIDMGYVRFYFSKTDTTSKGVENFCWRYAIITSAAVGILSFILWQMLFGKPYDNFFIALIVGLTIILFVTNTMSQTGARLRQKYRRIGLAIIASGIFATSTTVTLAILWRTDEWPLLIGFTVGILVSVAITGLPKGNPLGKPSGLTAREKWSIVRLGLPGLVTGTMYWILSSSDRWLLKYFWGEQTVGVYSFAYNVAIIGIIVNTAMVLTWVPESIRTYEKDRQGASTILGEVWEGLALLLCLVWLFVASIGGDMIRLLADSRFHGGALYVPWIAGGVYFYGMAQLANTGLLISKNMKPAANLWFLGGVFNLISNYFVIQIWGAYGAAAINCISFGFIYFGVMWKSTRYFKLNLAWRKLIGTGVVVLICGVLMSSAWHSYPLVSICFKLPICLGISLCLTWLTVPSWVNQFRVQLKEFRNRIR